MRSSFLLLVFGFPIFVEKAKGAPNYFWFETLINDMICAAEALTAEIACILNRLGSAPTQKQRSARQSFEA